jgi:hypothetical protein
LLRFRAISADTRAAHRRKPRLERDNDPELEDYAEKYGRYMSVEAGLMEWMREIAVNKVRLLLSDLVAIPQYLKRMQEERYDFLRTRAAYDVCMQRAYKRWKWVSEKLR